MRVYFWGTRGSLPASITAETVRAKIVRAIKSAESRTFRSDSEIEDFIRDELPFTVGRTYGSNTPCVEIKNGDEYMICDAGTGLRDLGNHHMKLIEQGLQRRSGSVFNIFVSHFHWDHIQGFPFFTPAYIPGNKVRIYGFHKNLKGFFEKQQNQPYFPVPLASMSADIQFIVLKPGREYEISGFKISGIEQKHPGTSYGFRFQKDGRTVVYSTDAEHKTSYDSTAREENYPFLDFFREADLLIFDAQYDWNEAVLSKDDWGHSSYVAAVELAVKAKVKHLCLFHNEPTYSDERLDVLLEDTRNYLKIYNDHQPHPMKIDLAYDGYEIEV
ncbi:MAG: ribonuclease Z [Syntrophorhabdus sp. PtaB.Bin184]|nr:MAG: ribonuclease Z [Syntrophorhabdus sp. PtaB.Bin184]